MGNPKAFTQNLDQVCLFPQLLFYVVVEVLAIVIWGEKSVKDIYIREKKVKLLLFLFIYSMIVENPKDVTKHRMRTDHLKTTEPVLLLHICHKSSETEMKKK